MPASPLTTPKVPVELVQAPLGVSRPPGRAVSAPNAHAAGTAVAGTGIADVDAAAQHWREHGWVLVEGLVPTADIDFAVEELWDLYPHPDEFHRGDAAHRDRFRSRSYDQGHKLPAADTEGAAFRADQFLGHILFPYESPRLNRLQVHPGISEFARLAMGMDDIRIYQARIWGKYTGVTNYEQPFHQDRNHNVVPDRLAPGWWNLEGFLYLSDVEADVAPTELAGGPADASRPYDGPPGGDRMSAAGVRGSFLAYRPDVWHRGVDLTRPGGSRFLMSASFKPAGADWIGYDCVQPVTVGRSWINFAATCSPAELALFGAPLPGHPYWTSELVEALERRYPGIDVTPWRDALA
ncbi:hypothetical protein [Candidatus Poriferisodalis sp.]|uniref:hypothetical protein n=1 Tax=Candidatus Poriferisodalis sp. TaxID=3101277 RepID=UPI003B01019C